MMGIFVGCSKDNDDENEAVTATHPIITLNKEALFLEKGKDERLIAGFTPADTPNKSHTWNSSAPNIATVDDTGLITAVDKGETTITVTALDGKKTATCKVTVVDKIIHVTGVSLDQAEATIAAGDGIKLAAIIEPATATDQTVAWSSSDNKIAAVDNSGNVTAIAKGNATITATTNDSKKTASCKITVVDRGVEISKPVVSDITSISALVTGTAKPLGVKIKEVGICYSTSPSPTIENEKEVLFGENISSTLTKLTPNTTYYVRIYTIVDNSAKYGDQAMFTTKTTVEISIPQISDISTYTAYIRGTITTFGIQTEETGICYSTSQTPTVNDTKVVLSSNSIAYTLNELTPEITYYVRIYAKINGEIYYGEQGKFTTLGIMKTHFKATDIYEDKITLTSTVPTGITNVNICYGTSPHPKITDNTTTATVSGGLLRLNLTSLKKAMTYYIRAYNLTGSNIEYFDDEVSVQTMGQDFSINYKFDMYQKYYINTVVTSEFYRIFLDYTYYIKPTGTYLVELDHGGGYLKKDTDYSNSIYIEDGTGTFFFKKELGTFFDISYITFQSESDIIFTNIESKIRYHSIVEKTIYARKIYN